MAENITLACEVFGDDSVFSVDIARSAQVKVLEQQIFSAKQYRKRGVKFPASELKLYLAKNADGAWLKETDITCDLTRKQHHERMLTLPKLETYFGSDFSPEQDAIQVLVELPQPGPPSGAPGVLTPASKLTAFEMALKQCSTCGSLPSEGEFLNMFDWTDEDCGTMKNIEAINAIVGFTGSQFYVRKEILCILENFKKVYRSEFAKGRYCELRFILMGSPGASKSCILALICFCIAVVYERPVVWRRQVE